MIRVIKRITAVFFIIVSLVFIVGYTYNNFIRPDIFSGSVQLLEYACTDRGRIDSHRLVFRDAKGARHELKTIGYSCRKLAVLRDIVGGTISIKYNRTNRSLKQLGIGTVAIVSEAAGTIVPLAGLSLVCAICWWGALLFWRDAR